MTGHGPASAPSPKPRALADTDAEGNLLEKYAYAPFGGNTGETRASIGFSSEAFDAATDLNYYNYRYYAPGLGRWTKRDSIDEKGGLNLFAVCSNNITNDYDVLGLACCNGVRYNVFTQCCCHGEILRNKEIATGIKICKAIMGNSANNNGKNSMFGISHYWVEVDQTSIHFSGDGFVGNEIYYRLRPGVIEIYDNYEKGGDGYAKLPESPFFKGRGKVCAWIYLNPCIVNISLAKQIIIENARRENNNPPGYNVFIFNCQYFAEELVNKSIYEAFQKNECGY